MLFHLRAENKRATAGMIHQSDREGDGRTHVGGGSTAIELMRFAPAPAAGVEDLSTSNHD